ncbi:MAG: hypothetical protein IT317_05840 [Anaerolineales bacterium]|nr:hypothetical protein [Anaerolineales bacterium]
MPPKRPARPPAPAPRPRPARQPPRPAAPSPPPAAKAVRPPFRPGADDVLSLFAVAAPGLEKLAAQELRALGLEAKAHSGGAAFSGRRADMYRANLWLRTASRVLVRVGSTYAGSFSELRDKAARFPWEAYLRPGQAVAVRVTSHKSRLYHTAAVAERVAGAIGDALGQEAVLQRAASAEAEEGNAGGNAAGEAAAGPAAQLVVARLVDDRCTLSVDSSGALLHQRGYRLATAKAPLRETLAAALLLASGWDKQAPLVDPFCGAGTIPIEAAWLAQNQAPGRARRFAFMDWPDYEAARWAALLAEAEAARVTGPAPLILGYDRDAGAIGAARANAGRAGVAQAVQFGEQALSALQAPPGRGWLVTNPPYGARVHSGGDLRDLYAQLGHVLRAQCVGWQAGFLCGDQALARASGLRFDLGRSLHLLNGGLPVDFLQARVSAEPA